jgi:hypothetical protein
LQDRLAVHFSLEEAYGYCEDALEVAPRLSSQAAVLRAEHQKLFVEFCHLVGDAEQLLVRSPSAEAATGNGHVSLVQIAKRYETFRSALEEHERREEELIMAAYVDDVGVGD